MKARFSSATAKLHISTMPIGGKTVTDEFEEECENKWSRPILRLLYHTGLGETIAAC
jgi:hypothetical protein